MSKPRGILSDVEMRTTSGRLIFGIIFAILVIVSLLALFPIFIAFTYGLKSTWEIYKEGFQLWPRTVYWDIYNGIFSEPLYWKVMGRSFLYAGVGVLGQLAVSALAAFSLAYLKPLAGRVIFFAFLILMMIPNTVSIIFIYATMADLNLLNQYTGLWLHYAVSPLAVLIMKNTFEQVSGELYDAAKIDGASPLRIFAAITFPLSRSIFLVLGIIGFIAIWGDFLLPSLVLTQFDLRPVALMVGGGPINFQMALAICASAPPLLVAIVLQRYFTRGISIGAFTG
jgi:ABC-type glycerol-3-phosphate transport system permease component